MGSFLSFDELINQSISHEVEGEIADSLRDAQMALEQGQGDQNPDACAGALVRLGNIHYRLGHYQRMYDYAQQALAQASQDSRAQTDAQILMGIHAFETGSLEDAEAYFISASDLCRQIDYRHSQFRALHNLAACIYGLRGQFDLSLATDEEAYRIAHKINSPQQIIPLIAMANLCLDSGRYKKAHKLIEQIERIVIPGTLMQGYFTLLQAINAQCEGDVVTSQKLMDEAWLIVEKFGDISLRVFLCINRSRCLRIINNPSQAFEWANDAVEWSRRASARRMLGRALTERGIAEWQLGNFDRAENDLRNAVADLSTRQQQFDLTRAEFYLAALLHSRKNPHAGTIWQQAAERIISHDYSVILDGNRELAYPLISFYANTGNAKLADLSMRCMSNLQRVPPPSLNIYLLGTYRINQQARWIDERALRKRRIGELLALLLLDKSHSLSFDQVADALWPDKDATNAQMLFHQSTSSLRRVLEPKLPEKFASRYLTVFEGNVTLKLPEGSITDMIEFEKRCNDKDWEGAIALYKGDLLPGYLYANWAAVPREKLKRLYMRTLMVMAHRHLENCHPRETIDMCHRVLEIDPWQEDAVLMGMRAYLALNDRSGAIRIYRELESTLMEELQTAPQTNLQQLFRSLI